MRLSLQHLKILGVRLFRVEHGLERGLVCNHDVVADDKEIYVPRDIKPGIPVEAQLIIGKIDREVIARFP
jgi:hypothetical protein